MLYINDKASLRKYKSIVNVFIPQVTKAKFKIDKEIKLNMQWLCFGLTKPLEELVINEGFGLVVYDGTSANPTSNNVEEALIKYKENNCEVLIAFGGGSVMDCAKAIGARIVKPKMSLKR